MYFIPVLAFWFITQWTWIIFSITLNFWLWLLLYLLIDILTLTFQRWYCSNTYSIYVKKIWLIGYIYIYLAQSYQETDDRSIIVLFIGVYCKANKCFTHFLNGKYFSCVCCFVWLLIAIVPFLIKLKIHCGMTIYSHLIKWPDADQKTDILKVLLYIILS